MRTETESAAWELMRSRYGGTWSIWRSDGGRWYATRMVRRLTRVQMDAGLAMTVSAEGADGLGALLAEQERSTGGVVPQES